MNKRILNTYLNKSDSYELKENCFKYNDKYLFSDSYSILVLNDNYDYKIDEEQSNMTQSLSRFIDKWVDSSEFYDKFIITDDKHFKIDDDWSFALENVKRIKNIINADKLEIYKTNNEYCPYLARLENSKTKEHGYLLPCRVH